MENHHFSWEISLFLWPFSVAMLVYQRVSPSNGSARAPVRSLRRYGGWKAAWQSVGVTPEDLITVAPWRSGWWAPWRSKKGWLNCLEFYLTFYLAGGESKQKPGLL